MAQRVLSPELKKQYDLMRDILQRCLSLTEKCSDADASGVISDRLAHMQSAALFVFVGEVKSGKSSFINALLGEEICEVAPDPCTAGIQELVYGEERTRRSLGDNWERVTLPATVLQDISIVDTPGTNSIIRNHQTITENYIPQSDLIIFVFPAKNPHTGSAWDLLSLIRKEWRRKTVFVLQQADLATQQELSVNQERVRQYARERNVQNPVVFTVSAKRETEGATDSGFSEFRGYLRDAVQSGDVWRMKVEGSRDTVR
ncbi:MAG: dynamin family protein, partial [Deltaproteobacteria bacterium]|nr:dynamin family protein [Deltaproteobacteria bacterium]